MLKKRLDVNVGMLNMTGIIESFSLYNIKHAKIKEYEHQIDQLVYKLYGLTDEEIKVVEGKSEI